MVVVTFGSRTSTEVRRTRRVDRSRVPLEQRCERLHSAPRHDDALIGRRRPAVGVSGQRRVATAAGQRLASWVCLEEFVPRTRPAPRRSGSGERPGATPVGASTGAALRMLAATWARPRWSRSAPGRRLRPVAAARDADRRSADDDRAPPAEHQRSAKASRRRGHPTSGPASSPAGPRRPPPARRRCGPVVIDGEARVPRMPNRPLGCSTRQGDGAGQHAVA